MPRTVERAKPPVVLAVAAYRNAIPETRRPRQLLPRVLPLCSSIQGMRVARPVHGGRGPRKEGWKSKEGAVKSKNGALLLDGIW